MQKHNVHIASLSNVTKNPPPSPLASSAELMSTSSTMRMLTQHLCTMAEIMLNAMGCTWMSWTVLRTFQAALWQSSAPRSETESPFRQVRPLVKEERTRFRVCLASVWDALAANVFIRREERRTASNTRNTAAPRCSIKASTHYPSSPSGPNWQAIDPAHTSDADHPKQSTNRIQLCASAVHKECRPRSPSRT